jgi:DNA-binding HxlR family transcriptional regulator
MPNPPALNSENCPVTHAVRVMGRRWKPLVLNYLKDGPLRFSELRRCIPEATQKMLTQTLRELERDGIVHRKSYNQVPPKVIYSITPYGVLRATPIRSKVWDAVAARTAEGSASVRIALVCRMVDSPCMVDQTNKASSSTAPFTEACSVPANIWGEAVAQQ